MTRKCLKAFDFAFAISFFFSREGLFSFLNRERPSFFFLLVKLFFFLKKEKVHGLGGITSRGDTNKIIFFFFATPGFFLL